jgi:hypothetical protein
MAKIALKQKRALPTWAYGALLLLAIVMFMLAFYMRERQQGDDGRFRAAEAPLTIVAASSNPDVDSSKRRPVAIRDAQMLRVTSDRVFWA